MKSANIPQVFRDFWKKLRFPELSPERQVAERHFSATIELEKTPLNSSISERDFIVVNYQEVPRWALLRCPCGCGTVISLPLVSPHKPRWSVYVNEKGLPSLFPSVWQNTGCKSHFVIRSGHVIWAHNTGVSPFEASPDFYQRRKPS